MILPDSLQKKAETKSVPLFFVEIKPDFRGMNRTSGVRFSRFAWLFLMGFTLMVFAGCDWEVVVRGCTDAAALNFEVSATEDDGSCVYVGQAVFWYSSDVSSELLFYKSETLRLFIDNELNVEWSAADYWLNAPGCGESASLTVEKSLEAGEAATATYRVEDNFGDILWEGIVAFNEGSCSAIELTL